MGLTIALRISNITKRLGSCSYLIKIFWIHKEKLLEYNMSFFVTTIESVLALRPLSSLPLLAIGVASRDWSKKSRGFVPPPSPALHTPHPPPPYNRPSKSNMWARGRAGLTRIATSVTWPQMTTVAFSPPPSSLVVVVETIAHQLGQMLFLRYWYTKGSLLLTWKSWNSSK